VIAASLFPAAFSFPFLSRPPRAECRYRFRRPFPFGAFRSVGRARNDDDRRVLAAWEATPTDIKFATSQHCPMKHLWKNGL
jgi:hypothetical protein